MSNLRPPKSKHRMAIDSPSLQRVLRALREAGTAGITTYQLFVRARTSQPSDAIGELRWHGVDITDQWEEGHKRFWLAEYSPAAAREVHAPRAGVGPRRAGYCGRDAGRRGARLKEAK